MKTDILQIHKNCLDFLLDWQAEHDDFYFVPRKINNKKRLEQGMYFRGNDDYMVLTFWDNADSKEFIYNINWSCDSDGVSSIELSCRDNAERVPYVVAVKELIEAQGNVFKETKPNRWRYFYPADRYYLDTLQDFILNEKPIIDKYLSSHVESGIPLADKELDDKYVKALPGYKGYIETIQKAKKTGAVKVKASDYIMTFQHNELSNAMVNYLKKNGYQYVKAEDDYVDISCNDSSGKKIFFELKTAKTVKAAIREAMGQLLEYNHYPNNNKADKLIIVTAHEPEKEDMQYLLGLRTIYHIPVYYQQFDMNKKNYWQSVRKYSITSIPNQEIVRAFLQTEHAKNSNNLYSFPLHDTGEGEGYEKICFFIQQIKGVFKTGCIIFLDTLKVHVPKVFIN